MPPKAAQPKGRGRPRDAHLAAQRRQQILDAAATLFARHGYGNTDVQFVADALQVGKGTVYRYFSSKESLFLAAVDRAMERLTERFDAEVYTIDDPLERMEHALRVYLGFFREHPEYVELLILERAEFRDRKTTTYAEHRDAHKRRWRELFRRLIAEGRMRDVPVERTEEVLNDLVYGMMFTNYFAARDESTEAQARQILDLVFHGILSDAERRKRKRRGTR
ncbi:MAG: TetR/AcrR family transcriptional regulator [Thermoguttaceae bacterium]